jgi:head-tail adaptor
MNAGALKHWVLLENPVEGEPPAPLNPAYVWASIRPAPPGSFDERKTTHEVGMRYHQEVTFNTRITHRGRFLYVRGIQNVEERNLELVLLCEEVVTP